jgi:ABC-2 type transport system permease protein
MAVYRRRYRAYSGETTGLRSRPSVLTRYAFRELLGSRLFLVYCALCWAAPLVGMVLIYLHFNAFGLAVLQTTVAKLVPIDGMFFLRFLIIQTSLGTVLAAVVGPGLIAPDLTNSALPLYLSRPLTRTGYVAGKLAVLVALMSVLTWVPLELMFALQCGLAGWAWLAANAGIGLAILGSSLAWIGVVSLLTLALSAWVRWRPVATALVFGYFFVSAGLGTLINEVMATEWGDLVNVPELLRTLWFVLFRVPTESDMVPAVAAALALGATCALFVALLGRRIRAYHVVRS